MPSNSSAAEPLRDIVDESFEEAAFLWRRWEAELTSLTRNLDEIYSWTEGRLHGAIDGVRVAGDATLDIALAAIASEDRHEVALGAAMLSSRTDAAAIEALTSALARSEGPALEAMLRGVALMGSNPACRAAAAALSDGDPLKASALCQLKAFRRSPIGAEGRSALAGPPAAQAGLLASAFYQGAGRYEDALSAGISNPDVEIQRVAIESGLSRGLAAARDAAFRLADSNDPTAAAYLRFVAMFGGVEDHHIIDSALKVPALQKAAIWALGHAGTIRAADLCVAGMRHEGLARACGEAYCWITGADLTRDRLEKPEPPAEPPAFDDDDLDADLVPARDELWPVPDVDAVREHWQSRKSAMAPDARYAQGVPASAAALSALVESGPMIRRADLVLELRVRTRGAYDVEPRAFAARQRQMMAAARDAVAGR